MLAPGSKPHAVERAGLAELPAAARRDSSMRSGVTPQSVHVARCIPDHRVGAPGLRNAIIRVVMTRPL